MAKAEYFRYSKHWWISLNISGKNRTDERSFWLQRCVDHIKPSTPRIWRTTTQVNAILDRNTMAPIIEFFLQLVAMERFPGGAHDKFKGKSTNELAYVQSDMIERWDPLFAVFRQNLRRVDFQDFILLQLDRIQLTVVCCNRWGV